MIKKQYKVLPFNILKTANMSAIAAAKRRRGVIEQPQPQSQQQQQQSQKNQQQQPSPTALTLPQVIQVVDKRLIALETFMKNKLAEDSSASASASPSFPQQPNNFTTTSTTTHIETVDSTGKVVNMSLKEMLEDFDKRYELLVEEVINIKNIVIDLQAYTMGVNKTLYDKFVATDSYNISAELEPEPEAVSPDDDNPGLDTTFNNMSIKYDPKIYSGYSGYDKSKEMVTGIIEM